MFCGAADENGNGLPERTQLSAITYRDGLPVSGAAVAYCRISACVLRRADENGVISFYGEAGVYRVLTEHRRKDTIWA